MLKSFVVRTLTSAARTRLAAARPFIVGITGSVGKSSAREAIAVVLAKRWRVGRSPKNYNTEIGLPLTVLELENPGKSVLGWLKVLAAARFHAGKTRENYPAWWVLEMGADKTGDIRHLTELARPQIAVVTAVGESHLEKFGSLEAIVAEKSDLVAALPDTGVAVLNRDDEKVWGMRKRTKARVVSFGFDETADVQATDVALVANTETGEFGTRLKITAGGATVPLLMPGVLGEPAAYAALAAAAVGWSQGMNLVEIADGLASFVGQPGRMRGLAGIKRTVIIDDSYNAAPKSVLAALRTLGSLPVGSEAKRYAVLGDMLELGSGSEEGHREVGRQAAKSSDVLIVVGERMEFAKDAAIAAGMSADRVFHFATAAEAGLFVQDRLHRGDAVLVKGSRGMRMETVTKELMADPMQAKALLCGEHPEW